LTGLAVEGAENAVPGRSMRWFKDRLVDVLKEAAGYAAQCGVPMVFEYTNRFEINTINTGVEAREIVERVGSSNLGILIDTYHSWLEDPDVCQNIRDLNGYVKHFHLHDSNRGAAIIAGGENDFDGILDTCGFPKDNFFYYKAWWTDRPVLHLLPHWNWAGKEGQEIDVRCFSNCEQVQ